MFAKIISQTSLSICRNVLLYLLPEFKRHESKRRQIKSFTAYLR